MSNKSEATWHPNSGPEVPHADLIAEARDRAVTDSPAHDLIRRLADALAALGDTVPRERYDSVAENRDVAWMRNAESVTKNIASTRRATAAERERDESRAERDALAHVIEQVREWTAIAPAWNLLSREGAKSVVRIIDHAPVSLALHDAEVKAQALDDAADSEFRPDERAERHRLYARAAEIRKHGGIK